MVWTLGWLDRSWNSLWTLPGPERVLPRSAFLVPLFASFSHNFSYRLTWLPTGDKSQVLSTKTKTIRPTIGSISLPSVPASTKFTSTSIPLRSKVSIFRLDTPSVNWKQSLWSLLVLKFLINYGYMMIWSNLHFYHIGSHLLLIRQFKRRKSYLFTSPSLSSLQFLTLLNKIHGDTYFGSIFRPIFLFLNRNGNRRICWS